ncbi:MAG TPA: bifunctional DNA primase/polymerase [Bacillota bacterium]
MTNPVLRTALACAARGLPVFPCQPGKKTPAAKRGYLDASTDPARIRDWFDRHPGRNLAVAAGAPGPDVLDVDERGPAGNGFSALARLNAAGLLAGASGKTRTPGGGLHVYFAGSRQRTSHLATCHLDFLSQGGYVLLPPSQVKGEPYQHVTGFARHGELDWQAVLAILGPSRGPAPRPPGHQAPGPQPSEPDGTRVDRLARWVAAQPEGNRNNGLFWAANRALETDQAADLSPLAAAARQAGLTEPEITATLRSARRTTQAHPEPRGPEAEGAS